LKPFLAQDFDACCDLWAKALKLEKQHEAKYKKEKNTAAGTLLTRMMYNTTKIMYERAERMKSQPKSDEWDGAEVLKEKHF